MGIIISDSIEQECLNIISIYTDRKYVVKRLLQSYPNLSEEKQEINSKSVCSFVEQAIGFFNATDDNVLTAPLTLFYSINNFAKAVFLVNTPNLSLTGSHGLNIDNKRAKEIHEIGDASCTVTKGTFFDLISITGDELAVLDEIRLKDVFSIIPELREIYNLRYFEEPNIFLVRPKENCTFEFEPIFQRGITEELKKRDYSLLRRNGYHLNLEGGNASLWVDASHIDSMTDNVVYTDVYGNMFFTNAISIGGKQLKISKLANLYICYYVFSMYVRYYPEKWEDYCKTADASVIRKLLVGCRREMLVEVLKYLSGDQIIFNTKVKEKRADLDGKEIFKLVMKEAREMSKQIGKNPFII